MKKVLPLLLAAALCSLLVPTQTARAQGTALTYQGRLNDGGGPANGLYDLEFRVFDAATDGVQAGLTVIADDLVVSNGLFTVTIDPGVSVFNGAARWLNVAVRPGASLGAYTNLAPRQPIIPTPYAIFAGGVTAAGISGTIPASQLSGTLAEAQLPANTARLNVTNTAQQATGAPVVTSGFITGANVIFGGSGYTAPPAVTINAASGSGAIITATVSGGVVTALNVQNAGSGYPANAMLTIAPPPSNGYQTFAGNNVFTGVNTFSSAGNIFSGNGRGLTNLLTTNLVGTIADTRLSTNVAVRSGGNTFNGTQIIATGNVGIGINAPSAKLEVVGTVKATAFAGAFSGDGAGLTNLPASTVESPANVIPVLGMVWIKPGTFIMGSRADELGRFSQEGPQTVVTLTKGFWMGVHEVTQGEYQAVIGSNPSGFTGDLNRPVEQVSWNDATNYCRRLTVSERTAGRLPAGWGYRLPTEAEWEYACRAGARTTRFGYGDDLSGAALANYAWHLVNSGNITHPVEQKLANPWGLMDMHGNVWEWCQNFYGTYPGGSVTDPQGLVSGSLRVICGGGRLNLALDCRSARRIGYDPNTRSNEIGFRVVLSPGQP